MMYPTASHIESNLGILTLCTVALCLVLGLTMFHSPLPAFIVLKITGWYWPIKLTAYLSLVLAVLAYRAEYRENWITLREDTANQASQAAILSGELRLPKPMNHTLMAIAATPMAIVVLILNWPSMNKFAPLEILLLIGFAVSNFGHWLDWKRTLENTQYANALQSVRASHP